MSARSTRQTARERILRTFQASLDRAIPADESQPLKGLLFVDFEDQVEAIGRDVLPVTLEERAALSDAAKVSSPGPFPHCESPRVYLKPAETQPELQLPHGPIVVPKQHARCRACGTADLSLGNSPPKVSRNLRRRRPALQAGTSCGSW